LFNNAPSLGISDVYRLRNCRVDGSIQLYGDKVVLLEVKYALSWQTACNARVEIQRFFEEEKIQKYFMEKTLS